MSLYATGIRPYSGLPSAWLIYWLGDSTGVLLVTPLIFTLPELLRSRTRAHITELLALVALTTFACFIVFGDFFPIRFDVFAFSLPPLVMWGAISFGIAGATLSVFLIASIATLLTALGFGPFSTSSAFTNAVMLDVLFMLLAISGLALASVIAERERAEGERERTIREQAEMEALERAKRKVILAQEAERARIARELHDDIGQRLALLTVNLTGVSEQLQTQASEIAADLQSLSHELHPSRIEVLGIVAGVRHFCQQFAEQQQIEVAFDTSGVPSQLPSSISLTLFRVLQEALRNAAKHSGVRRCEVRLWAAEGRIHLSVEDRGAGFDTASTKEGRGIGLITMQERVGLVDGDLTIESQPGGGTTIHARVPFSESEAGVAARA